MTISLLARHPQTGGLGMVICSSSPAVAARCVHLRAGVGVVASQNITHPGLGAVGLDALAAGAEAAQALRAMLDADRFSDYRQLAVVDKMGRTATHSGAHALGVSATATGQACVAAGNLLANAGVVLALVDGFTSSGGGALEERLLDGLEAGLAAGGEAGPVFSAGLQVVEDVAWPVTDLRVDWHPTPVAELRRLWQLWSPQKADYRLRALDPTRAPGFGVPGE